MYDVGYELDYDISHCSYQETQIHAERLNKLVKEVCSKLGLT